MRKLLYLVALLPVLAFAGKEEREFVKETVEPKVAAAEAAVKTSCGCALKITMSPALTTKDDLSLAVYVADSVTEGAPKYCTDAESKKAICQMSALTIEKAKEPKFTFSAGKGVATTDGSAYTTFDMMSRELDK